MENRHNKGYLIFSQQDRKIHKGGKDIFLLKIVKLINIIFVLIKRLDILLNQ